MELSGAFPRRSLTFKNLSEPFTPKAKALIPLFPISTGKSAKTPMAGFTTYIKNSITKMDFTSFVSATTKTPVWSPAPKPSPLLLKYLNMPMAKAKPEPIFQRRLKKAKALTHKALFL